MPAKQKPNVFQRPDGTWAFRLRAPRGYPGPLRPQFGGFKTERAAERAGWKKIEEFEAWDPDAPPKPNMPSIDALVDEFLAQYPAARDSYTRKCLTWNLNRIRRDLGGIRVDRLTVRDIAKWRATLPAGSAWHLHQALAQLLNYAVKVAKLIAENPASAVDNPRVKTRNEGEEIKTFTLAELDAISEELPPPYQAIPHFAAGTGLRPGEWIALAWDDIVLTSKTPFLRVERSYSHGELKRTKTKKARRVPLRDEALQALRRHPRRLDGGLVFEAWRPDLGRGQKAEPWIDYRSFQRIWKLALELAGVDYRTPYALRHTYATTALAAGIPTFNVARRMGTSLPMIEQTYGHLVSTADEWEVERLNEYDAAVRASLREAELVTARS
jgi:integrase